MSTPARSRTATLWTSAAAAGPLTVLHRPGHAAGHCGCIVEPDGFLFIADIDLTSFGPYYGDLSSNLEDFEASITRLREVPARWRETSRQAGAGDTNPSSPCWTASRLSSSIGTRPCCSCCSSHGPSRTYRAPPGVRRPDVQLPFTEAVERRTALLHVERLGRHGLVVPDDGGYLAV